MLILGKDTMKDPSLGYARTFVRQLETASGWPSSAASGSSATPAALNPAALADRLREVANGLGLDAKIAHVRGR